MSATLLQSIPIVRDQIDPLVIAYVAEQFFNVRCTAGGKPVVVRDDGSVVPAAELRALALKLQYRPAGDL